MIKDYGEIYQAPKRRPGDLPWTIPPMHSVKTRRDISKTLFGQQYLSIVVDEAHNFRNHGPKHLAALAILDRAVVRLPLTGTPLQTSPKASTAMLRSVNSLTGF